MVFQSDTYSVLLVSASEKLNTSMTALLPATDYWPVTVASSLSLARRLILETAFDLILVNSPLPDGSGAEFCADVCDRSDAGVLLMVHSELYEELYYKLLPGGVVTLPKPMNREAFTLTLRALCALRERLRASRHRQSTVEEKMEELRLVNRAKWLLMEKRGLSEEAAHRAIQRQAMEQRMPKADAAKAILRMYGSGEDQEK